MNDTANSKIDRIFAGSVLSLYADAYRYRVDCIAINDANDSRKTDRKDLAFAVCAGVAGIAIGGGNAFVNIGRHAGCLPGD